MIDGCVYIIKFKQDNRVYIGSSGYKRIRKSSHLQLLRAGTHHSKELQKCYENHGESSLEFEVIEKVYDRELLRIKEQIWIDFYSDRLLNASKNANGPTQQSDEFKENCRSRMRGNTIRRGKTMRESSKLLISESLIGNQYRKGKPHDEAIKLKISEGLKKAYANGTRKRIKPGEKL